MYPIELTTGNEAVLDCLPYSMCAAGLAECIDIIENADPGLDEHMLGTIHYAGVALHLL